MQRNHDAESGVHGTQPSHGQTWCRGEQHGCCNQLQHHLTPVGCHCSCVGTRGNAARSDKGRDPARRGGGQHGGCYDFEWLQGCGSKFNMLLLRNSVEVERANKFRTRAKIAQGVVIWPTRAGVPQALLLLPTLSTDHTSYTVHVHRSSAPP